MARTLDDDEQLPAANCAHVSKRTYVALLSDFDSWGRGWGSSISFPVLRLLSSVQGFFFLTTKLLIF